MPKSGRVPAPAIVLPSPAEGGNEPSIEEPTEHGGSQARSRSSALSRSSDVARSRSRANTAVRRAEKARATAAACPNAARATWV